MNVALGLRSFLIEAGIFVGTFSAGLGAYRFFIRAMRNLVSLPGQMERCACALEHSIGVMEKHNAMGTMMGELTNLVVATRDDLNRAKSEQEHFRREIRILARRIEGYSIYAQSTQ
jgi:hypothetical protein